MKLSLSSANVKIFSETDLVDIKNAQCLRNEGFGFQVFVQNIKSGSYDVNVKSELPVESFEVLFRQGNYDKNNKTDDFYLKPDDDKYPELLLPIEAIVCEEEENKTLYFYIPETDKTPGAYEISVLVGVEKLTFTLTVLDAKLAKNDLIVTHWFHNDGICNYFGVKPFSEEYYAHFKDFLEAYVRMGNTMLLIPMFTPPLDTEVGKERLTTQLVKVYKEENAYRFDFSEMKRYIDLAKAYGIEYFELSHLFTQWGGEYCPKIIVEENGEEKKLFGWETASTDEAYLGFLKAFLEELNLFLEAEGIKENTYMHLTDEPNDKHIEKYAELSKFVKENNFGVKTMDALSHYELVGKAKIDLPAVATTSDDMVLFANMRKLLYYCTRVDRNCLTNRYFHMPLLRTLVLGVQLYQEQVQGFLHWGYNFYNLALSKGSINPYEDATAGGAFEAGDPFVVYPAKDCVNYSMRYFALKKAFEDYRLLKATEEKAGRSKVEEMLNQYGFLNLETYPHAVEIYDNLRADCYKILNG